MGFIFSLGLILSIGFIAGYLLNKMHIPGLTGMIIVGLVFGPYCLNLIDGSLLAISSELRQIALVIILTRSGLNLDIQSLRKIGRPAILLSFVPASLEIIGVMLASHFLLSINYLEGLLLGSVLAAVSPAVVSPRMIKLIEEGYGEEHQVPKMVLAGSSVDDIYVIVLFYAFLGLVSNNSFSFLSLMNIPLSIILGIVLGVVCGLFCSLIIKRLKMPNASNILVMLFISFLMIGLENILKPYIAISSLLGILVMAMVVLYQVKEKAKDLSKGYNSLWLVFEIILFVLVGACVDYSYAFSNFLMGLVVLFIGLVFRSIGVCLCVIKTNLTFKERLFVVISYLPKATVQASIGGIALSMGLSCGSIVLTVAVIAIMISAPIGAFLIDIFGRKLLTKDSSPSLILESEIKAPRQE